MSDALADLQRWYLEAFGSWRVAPDPDARGLTRADIMKAAEVAALLSVPVSTVLHWGRTGALRRVKLGRHVRFLRADVERLVRGGHDDVS